MTLAVYVRSRQHADGAFTFGCYCELCCMDGLRKFLLDTDRTDALEFTWLNVGISEESVRCDGCGRQWTYGREAAAEALRRAFPDRGSNV